MVNKPLSYIILYMCSTNYLVGVQ